MTTFTSTESSAGTTREERAATMKSYIDQIFRLFPGNLEANLVLDILLSAYTTGASRAGKLQVAGAAMARVSRAILARETFANPAIAGRSDREAIAALVADMTAAVPESATHDLEIVALLHLLRSVALQYSCCTKETGRQMVQVGLELIAPGQAVDIQLAQAVDRRTLN